MEEITFRLAGENDLAAIIQMLSDDPLGALRENVQWPLPETYQFAFDTIQNDVNQELMVAMIADEIVGTFQLTFIQYLTHQGGLRAQIEAVRVHSARRGKGIGARMFRYAIDRASAKGCHVVQLTTDKTRPGAIHFYETLGFVATHEGMKLNL